MHRGVMLWINATYHTASARRKSRINLKSIACLPLRNNVAAQLTCKCKAVSFKLTWGFTFSVTKTRSALVCKTRLLETFLLMFSHANTNIQRSEKEEPIKEGKVGIYVALRKRKSCKSIYEALRGRKSFKSVMKQYSV